MASNELQAPNNQGLLSDQDFERLRADVMNAGPQTMPVQGIIAMQSQQVPTQLTMHTQQQQAIPFIQQQHQQIVPRGINQQQWRTTLSQQQQQPPSQPQSQLAPILKQPMSHAQVERTVIKKDG